LTSKLQEYSITVHFDLTPSRKDEQKVVGLNGARSILDLIGSTPVVKLRKLPGKNDAEVWAKMESFNPGGSVKDRICLSMIEAAEREGKLKPGATIIEPTSGNTGIGLALIAAVKGYRLILTMPDTMSEERRSLLAAYGARLILTPDTKGMGGAIHKAEELVEAHSDYFMPQQFNNPANPEVHRRTTAVELLRQFKRIDAFVAGVGTGGTITGVGEVLKDKLKAARIYAVEPSSSRVISGGEPGYHKIQGIGAGFIPAVLNRDILDEVVTVSDEDAASNTRRLASEEGLLVGISSGAACCAALKVAKALGKGHTVVTIFADKGEHYLSTDLFGDKRWTQSSSN
jgi:cysteine synthase A